MERGQFTFYRSYREALEAITDPAERCRAYDAIIGYALDGTDPELTPEDGIVYAIFTMARPTMDSGREKAGAGSAPKARKNKNDSVSPTRKNKNDSVSPTVGNKIEIETEIEGEAEKESKTEVESKTTTTTMASSSPDPCHSPSLAYYAQRIAALPSELVTADIIAFERELGPDLCKLAMDIALGEQNRRWSYIRGILTNMQQSGIKTIDDWRRSEEERLKRPTARGQPASSSRKKSGLEILLEEEGGTADGNG